MRLECQIINPDDLTLTNIDQMFELMQLNYVGVTYSKFQKDLRNKSKLFLFFGGNKIQGFTGLRFDKFAFKEEFIHIAYSGDTVLAREYRGSLAIPVFWGRYMLAISESQPRLYWLLTSKGFRTYRYLSVFFKDFIPKPGPTNQYLLLLRERIAKHYFGDEYKNESGILSRSGESQVIRNLVEDQKAIFSSKDSFIHYFANSNPDFSKGHELVCLAHFHETNISPFIYRILKSGRND